MEQNHWKPEKRVRKTRHSEQKFRSINLHQMGAEKMTVEMPETFDSMRISSVLQNPPSRIQDNIHYKIAYEFVFSINKI